MASGKDEPADRPELDSESGNPESAFGPSLNDFGPSLNDFGPSLNDFGPAVSASGPAPDSGKPGWTPESAAPGWTPAPAGPDVAWRPAGSDPQSSEQYSPSSAPAASTAPTVATPGRPAVDSVAAEPVSQKPGSAGERPGTGGTDGDEPPASWWRPSSTGFPPTPPAENAAAQGESLSWADDPIGRALAPKPGQSQSEPSGKPARGRFGAIAGGVVALLVVAAAVVVVVMRTGSESEPTDSDAAGGAHASGVASSTAAALSCPAKREGNLVIGNGPGGTSTGADAILGFQHAFYAERSGVKARGYVAPDAVNVAPADIIQTKGIDGIPGGTSYCLRIVEVGPEVYDVDLTEHRNDGTTKVYPQHITTVNRDGKHLIYSID